MADYATGDVLPLSEVNSKPRTRLLQEDAVPYRIPLSAFRWADGLIPETTGAAGKPKLVMAGYGSGDGHFLGEDSKDAAKTETIVFDFSLPAEYVAGQTVTVTVTAQYTDAGTSTMTTKTIDCEAYKIAEAGTAGSDICATAIQTLTSSMAQYSFTVTPASLSAGDSIRVFLQIITEGDTSAATKGKFGGASVALDIKG